jgi:hypothetical protein
MSPVDGKSEKNAAKNNNYEHEEKAFRRLKEAVREVRNIVDPIDEVWDVDSEYKNLNFFL